MTAGISSHLAAHLWQSTVVVGIAAAVAWLLRGNRARARHAVWTLASVKFLVPFAVLVAAGGQLSRLPGIAGLSGRAVAELPGAPGVIYWFETAAQPFGLADVPVAMSLDAPTPAISMPTLLLALWIAGTLLVLGVWVARWTAVTRLPRAATPLVRGREAEMLARTADRTGLPPVRLLASTGSMEPGVVGWLHPAILWPVRISERMTDEQIAAIMLHELVHVRRRDNLWSIVHMVVEAVFWFHPLVWWVGSRLIDVRELACDEEVIRLGTDPGAYAESILRTCEYAAESRLACVAGVTGADLTHRLAAIVRPPAARLSTVKLVLLTSLGVAGAVGPIAAGALTSPTGTTSSSAAAPSAPQPPGGPVAPAVADPRFEVASIKVVTGSFMTSPGAASVGFPAGGRFMMRDGAAVVLLRLAYPDVVEVVGLPDWANGSLRLDVDAKGAEGTTSDQAKAMLRTMLAERFRLSAHQETRNFPTYDLRVARDDGRLGPELRRYAGDCQALRDATQAGRPRPEMPAPSNGATPCGMLFTDRRILAGGIPMSMFALNLGGFAERTVIDRTNLEGFYELSLTHSPDVPVFTAVHEQLGLKLEPSTAPLPVLVVDRIERPTPN